MHPMPALNHDENGYGRWVSLPTSLGRDSAGFAGMLLKHAISKLT